MVPISRQQRREILEALQRLGLAYHEALKVLEMDASRPLEDLTHAEAVAVLAWLQGQNKR